METNIYIPEHKIEDAMREGGGEWGHAKDIESAFNLVGG